MVFCLRLTGDTDLVGCLMNCMSIPNVFAERILHLRHLKNGSALLALMHLFLLVISFLFIPEHCGWTHYPHLLKLIQSILLFLASCIPYYSRFSLWLIFVTYVAYTVTVFRVTCIALPSSEIFKKLLVSACS